MTQKKSFTLITILLTAGLMVLLNSCMQTSYTYGISGTPALSADGQYVTVLVAESKGITRQVNGGYRATDYSTAYWLKQYKTATGKLIKKKKIIPSAEKDNMLVYCYGGYGDNIWLGGNSIKAYSISSLEETVNEEQLIANNRFDINNFPSDRRFIEQHVAEGFINFTAESGDKFKIDLTTLQFSNRNDAAKKTGDVVSSQISLLNDNNNSNGFRCDTLNGKIFILAKDSINAVKSQPGNHDERPVYSRLYLFTANYITGNIGNYRYYNYSKMHQLSGASYINGFFLKDFKTNKIIQLQKPGIYIILHNDSLNNEAKSILTAIDESNHTIWQINTGLSTKLATIVVKNNYCIITGNKHYLLAPHTGSDMLCIVNMQTGKMSSPSIKE